MKEQLRQALTDLRQAREYARTADTDAEQAELAVFEATTDLLEAVAEHLLEAKRP